MFLLLKKSLNLYFKNIKINKNYALLQKSNAQILLILLVNIYIIILIKKKVFAKPSKKIISIKLPISYEASNSFWKKEFEASQKIGSFMLLIFLEDICKYFIYIN